MPWIPTNKHVYHAIYSEHEEKLSIFSTYSNPTGDDHVGSGYPEMRTQWGFKGADFPIIKCIGTKKNKEQKEYDYKHWIFMATKDDSEWGCDCE